MIFRIGRCETAYILPRRITAITSVFGTENGVSTTPEATNIHFT